MEARASRLGIVVLFTLMLIACDKPSDKAKREYGMMVRAGASGEERCGKKREIAEAFLKEGNEREYAKADLDASLECNRVLLESLRS